MKYIYLQTIKTISIFILFAIFFCLPFLLNISSTFPRLDSDYDSVLPIYNYIAVYIKHFHTFPTQIPFIGKGIPAFSDPLNAFLYPVFSLPLLAFPINIGIRLVILFTVILSGISMFYLLRKMNISGLISYMGGILYMTSGSITSSIAAGHITEKFLTFPFIPIFLLLTLEEKYSLKKQLLTGFLLALCLYCADFYMAWFLIILLICIRGYYFFITKQKVKSIREVIMVGFITLFFASPKLFLLVRDVLPIMKRSTVSNPFFGSIDAFLLPLQFLVPFQVNFYDRPFFQRHLGFYYNWYEYYAFIGLFPIIFLKNIKQLLINDKTKILLLVILVGSLYVSNAYLYSPFHWLFLLITPLDIFRVPQRIAIPLTAVVILLICMCADKWKKKVSLRLLFGISLVWTFAIGWFTFSYTFVPIPKEQSDLVNQLAKSSEKNETVVSYVPQTQWLLIQKGVTLLNYYYGWVPKSTPDFVINETQINWNTLIKVKPAYILSAKLYNFSNIGYTVNFRSNNYVIWKKTY